MLFGSTGFDVCDRYAGEYCICVGHSRLRTLVFRLMTCTPLIVSTGKRTTAIHVSLPFIYDSVENTRSVPSHLGEGYGMACQKPDRQGGPVSRSSPCLRAGF